MNIRKKGLWTFLALVLAAATIWMVIRGSGMSLREFMSSLRDASPVWIAAAFLCMFDFILFEGEAVRAIIRNIGYPQPPRRGFLYAAADVYFSAITPSATGGQPASAFFMMKDGVPAAVTTAALLVNLVCYNVAIMAIGILSVALRPQVFLNFQPLSRILITGGFIVITALTFLFLILLQRRDFLFRHAQKLIRLLFRLHLIHDLPKWEDRLSRTMEEYGQCVRIIAGHRPMWVQALSLNLLQRIFQILVTGAAYRALGGVHGIWKLLVTQGFVVIGSNCMPIPGAMGVADYLMLDGYSGLMEHDLAFQVQLLSRSISFYSCILFSGLIVFAAILLLHKREGKRR